MENSGQDLEALLEPLQYLSSKFDFTIEVEGYGAKIRFWDKQDHPQIDVFFCGSHCPAEAMLIVKAIRDAMPR